MTGDQDVARLAAEAVANPFGRIIRLEVARRRKIGESVTCTPECFGGLTGAKLAAVPDDRRTRASRRSVGGKALDVLTAAF